jgi:large subunit ribosomal protein L6
MSKVGKKSIAVPTDVTIVLENNTVKATGPKGSLECKFGKKVKVEYKDNVISVLPLVEGDTQYQGLYRTLIDNIITGVKTGVEKKLEFHGIGYKANVDGSGDLILNVGYSHPVKMKKIEGITYSVAENVITVSGIDKVLIGDIAAKIRKVRAPEPYKGKGIRYQGEVIIKKETKSA